MPVSPDYIHKQQVFTVPLTLFSINRTCNHSAEPKIVISDRHRKRKYNVLCCMHM